MGRGRLEKSGAGFTVLVVEDDPGLQKYFKAVLMAENYAVIAVDGGREAVLRTVSSHPDMVLTDVGLPDMDGIALCRELRGDPQTASIPVIMVSGQRMEEEYVLAGMDNGADDYLLKPVSGRLLLAKMAAVLRRYVSPNELAQTLQHEGLTLDARERKVAISGRDIALTRKEFDLLNLFLRKKGRLISKAYLLETVWGLDSALQIDMRTIKVHVSSLRAKLGRLGARIVSVQGSGYRFEI